jgi:hypothetical protein
VGKLDEEGTTMEFERLTNGAGTNEWLIATKGLTILAFVPGDHSSQFTVAVSAQADGAKDDQTIRVPAPAESA